MTRKQADKARQLWTDTDLSQRAIGRIVGIQQNTVSLCVRNLVQPDPEYKIPDRKLGYYNLSKCQRKPAGEHPFQCPTCGMGYESYADADNCCARMYAGDGGGKYS